MELPLRIVVSCKVCTVIHFSFTQNKSAVEIQQENVFGIQQLYVQTADTAMARTYFPMNFNR